MSGTFVDAPNLQGHRAGVARVLRTGTLLALMAGSWACSSGPHAGAISRTLPPTSTLAPTTTGVPTSCLDRQETDIRQEPHYALGPDQLVPWYENGCRVRRDIVITRREPTCPPESIVMGVPLGTPQGRDSRVFDSPSVVPRMPAAARPTGYTQEGGELWLVTGDFSAIYVRAADATVKRWHWDQHPVGCV
ncbi:MAG: hypothetical protein ACYDH6_15630 [Acidimicrobiales bacterium]